MPKAAIPKTLRNAIQHHQAGRLAQAEVLYRQILAVDPHCADAVHFTGLIAHQLGDHTTAIELLRQALALAPGDPAIHANLGEVYRTGGRLDEAVVSFRHALGLQPDYPDALNNLGNTFAAQGRLDEAVRHYRQALALLPTFAKAHNNLGIALTELGQFDHAVMCFDQALALEPGYAEAYNNLGSLFTRHGHFDRALASLQQAIALKPDYAAAHNNLGNVFLRQGRPEEAITCYRQALALQPDLADAHNNLGTAFKDQGRLDEAIACHRQALSLNPQRADIHSNLILALLYRSGDDAEAIDHEVRLWNQQHARPLAGLTKPHGNEHSPNRRLRIGYVSPDFRAHPVGRFMAPLFAAHDRQAVELFCYSGAQHTDHVTAQFRAQADHWRDVAGQTDRAIASLIRDDRIDILVDLALHTAGNRLPVFTLKPAPIQATYLAYPGKSGLEGFDYWITDPHLDPPGRAAPPGIEQPIRLPETYWCYQSVIHPPPAITPLPAQITGHVTFACLNNFCKVTPITLTAWCRLLVAVPTARLRLHSPRGSHRAGVHDTFATGGVDPLRVCFVDHVPEAQYFQLYQSIDIGLDPFPFPGGTTTCDALWMGVPVVSLAGHTPVTRGGLSLLSNAGLADLVASSVADYVEIAAALARDLPRLASLRATLRDRLQRSPLMDTARFARAVEAAYRTMWHQWCAQSTPRSPPSR
jgi:protein O-GlcNAc transferase